MILRIDRIAAEIPPPSGPDPAGAAAVQELLGGQFGEMSTLMNSTFQSFNFRNRQGARPFYDLVANAAEEFGHIELVAATINTMLTDAPLDEGKQGPNRQHFIAGGKGALPQDSMGKPWTGENVFASGDLVEDLTHNFFLETGARQNKLKVHEMVDHPAARALTGYPLPTDPDREDPRVPAAHRPGAPYQALSLLPERLPRACRRLERDASRDRRAADRRGRGTRGRRAARPPGPARRLRARLRTRGDRRDRQEAPGGGRAPGSPDRGGRLRVTAAAWLQTVTRER